MSIERFRSCSALLLTLIVVCGSSAQSFHSAAVQTVTGTPTVIATGDFNRDGIADLIYQDGFTGGNLHVMSGNGDGTFREIQQVALPLNVGRRITVADLNNDGFPDLIVGYDGFYSNFVPAEFTALLNRGDGTFSSPIFSPFPILAGPESAYNHIAVSDFDGDGHTDFIFAASAGLLLMRGDGTGRFTPTVLSQPLSYGDMRDVYLADFNEDGKGDVAINGIFGVYYALNLGGGTFGPLTTLAQVLNNPPPGFGVADVNSDGHQDIVYGYNGSVYVAYGRGDGTFAAPRASGTCATPPGYSYLAIRDVNGDGRPDIVTSNSGSPTVQLQNASGQFTYSYGNVPAVGDRGLLAPVFADFDGDGVGDVITGGTGALVFSKGSPNGTFTGARAILAGGTLDLEPADLNLDGHLDVAITVGGGSYYGSVHTYLGDGTGAFTQQGYAPNPYPTFAGQSSVADFNGDGVPDVFNAGYLLKGDGAGGFLPSVLIAAPPSGNRPEGFTVAADFNEDGRPDAVTTTASSIGGTACSLAVGLPSGINAWTTQQLTLPYVNGIFLGTPVCAGPLVSADFNGDAHKDLATASFGSIYTYFGDGKGNFAVGPVIPIGYTAGSYYGEQSGQNDLEAADLDGDGKIDLIVPIADQNVIQIFYGHGDGTFDTAVSLPTAQDVRYVTVADMNQDGIPDMILGGHALVRILHGLGGRKFEAAPTSYPANPFPQKIRVADVNNDGNPDLLVPNGGYSAIVEPGDSFTVLLNAAPPASPDLLIATLGCMPEPSPIGLPFSCSATFTPAANSTSPAGVVSFTLDGVAAGTSALTANKATFAFPATVSPGLHTVTVTFPGDTNFLAAVASTVHVVSLTTASIVLSGPAHVAFGQVAALQVALSGNFGTPTGMVNFTDGLIQLAQVVISSGRANTSISTLAPGTHILQASYSGDASYAAGLSNMLTIIVDAQPTSIVLLASPITAPFSTTITLQATVSAPAGPVTGTVQFLDGVNQIGIATVNTAGVANCATAALALGSHTLTAQFVATPSFAASTSAGVQVNVTGIQTLTALTAAPNPSYLNQAVALVATVTSALPSQPPAGIVRFFDGNTVIANVPLAANGSATLSISTLPVGSHSLSANYLGSSPLVPSQSNTVQEVVLNSNFTLAVTPPEITLQTQHHMTFSLKVTPVGLFSGVVTLGCGPLPVHATCQISSQTVTLTSSGSTQTASVYLDTSDVIGYARSSPAPVLQRVGRTLSAVLVFPLLAGYTLGSNRKRVRQLGRLVLLAATLFTCAFSFIGCSGKYPASVVPGSYTLQFTGSSSNPTILQTAPLQLTVTP